MFVDVYKIFQWFSYHIYSIQCGVLQETHKDWLPFIESVIKCTCKLKISMKIN